MNSQNPEPSLSQADSELLVKWYCSERLVLCYRNLPISISGQARRDLALISSQLHTRGIRICDVDFASRSCAYVVDGAFYVTDW